MNKIVLYFVLTLAYTALLAFLFGKFDEPSKKPFSTDLSTYTDTKFPNPAVVSKTVYWDNSTNEDKLLITLDSVYLKIMNLTVQAKNPNLLPIIHPINKIKGNIIIFKYRDYGDGWVGMDYFEYKDNKILVYKTDLYGINYHLYCTYFLQ